MGSGTWLSVKDVTKLKKLYDCQGDKNVTLYLFYPVIYLFRFIYIYIKIKVHAIFKDTIFCTTTIITICILMYITVKNHLKCRFCLEVNSLPMKLWAVGHFFHPN